MMGKPTKFGQQWLGSAVVCCAALSGGSVRAPSQSDIAEPGKVL